MIAKLPTNKSIFSIFIFLFYCPADAEPPQKANKFGNLNLGNSFAKKLYKNAISYANRRTAFFGGLGKDKEHPNV